MMLIRSESYEMQSGLSRALLMIYRNKVALNFWT